MARFYMLTETTNAKKCFGIALICNKYQNLKCWPIYCLILLERFVLCLYISAILMYLNIKHSNLNDKNRMTLMWVLSNRYKLF